MAEGWLVQESLVYIAEWITEMDKESPMVWHKGEDERLTNDVAHGGGSSKRMDVASPGHGEMAPCIPTRCGRTTCCAVRIPSIPASKIKTSAVSTRIGGFTSIHASSMAA